MAGTTSKVKLPRSVVTELLPKVKDNSVIATLCANKPQTFNENETIVFTPTAEAEVVEEGAKKGSYEIATGFVSGVRVKVQTTTRVTEELKWADEDDRLEIISNIQADQAGAIGRALDYVAIHGINPATKAALAAKYTHLTGMEGIHEVVSGASETDNIDAMLEALIDWDFNGIALSRKYASDLRKLRVPSTMARLYPEIPLNLEVGSFEGLRAATSATVNGRLAKTPTGIRAIMGNFDLIKWGMGRDMTAEIIEYGDPDQTGVDLKANGQIAYRTQAVFSYGILDAGGFCVLRDKAGE